VLQVRVLALLKVQRLLLTADSSTVLALPYQPELDQPLPDWTLQRQSLPARLQSNVVIACSPCSSPF
jgi:hypothetical protein